MNNIITNYQTNDGWFDFDKVYKETKLLSYVVGARGMGKTYSSMLYAFTKGLEGWIEDNQIETSKDILDMEHESLAPYQFFFLRRYKEQLHSAKHVIFHDDFLKDFINYLSNHGILDEWELKTETQGKGSGYSEVRLRLMNRENNKEKRYIIIGYISSITASESVRGLGFPRVKIIIFDEFQPKTPWDFVKNEPNRLLDIYESITRGRDDCKMFCLGNSGSILNIHFYYWNYDEFTEEKTSKRDGTIIFYHLKNVPPTKTDDSNFAKLIRGTDYGDYSIGNEFADNQDFNVLRIDDMVDPVTNPHCVRLDGQRYGVLHTGDGKFVISRSFVDGVKCYVEDNPIYDEIINLQPYEFLANLIGNKKLYYETPDLRLIAEKHLRKYLFKEKGIGDTFQKWG